MTHLSVSAQDHSINLSSYQCNPGVKGLIFKGYINIHVNHPYCRRRPWPGSRDVHSNHSQWAGAPASGTPANGPMHASVQCDAWRTAYRLTAAITLVLLSEALHWMMVTIIGLSDGVDVRPLARLIGISTATLGRVDELHGCMLPAAGRVGRLQISRKPVGRPDTVELVRLYGASGMPHNRDCRRYAASHRAGGAYGCLPAQLRWFGQDETARSGAPVDSAVPSCDVTTIQGESGRCTGMVQTGCGSSSDLCGRTRQDGGRAAWVAAPWPQERNTVALQREQTASWGVVIWAFSGINGTEPGSGPVKAMTGGFLIVFSTAVRKLADAAQHAAVAESPSRVIEMERFTRPQCRSI
jgi:hypothetical protein